MVDMGGLWEIRDTRIVVDTYGIFWRNAMAINSYTEFERRWMDGRNQISHWATYLRCHRLFRWICRLGPQTVDQRVTRAHCCRNPDWYLSPNTPQLCPSRRTFRITRIIQNGVQVEASPVDAARTLLQARYDLEAGILGPCN